MQHQTARGFFDTNESSFKLWDQPSSKALRDQKCILSAQFFKRSKNDSSYISSRAFVLTQKYLLYKKNLQCRAVRGLMEVERVRVYFSSPSERNLAEETEETKHMYAIKFVRNMKYTQIFTKDMEVFKEWRKALGKLAIMTDFHERYEVISQLGKGSFAMVRIQ